MVVSHVGVGQNGERRAVLHDGDAAGVVNVTTRCGRFDLGVLILFRLAFVRAGGKHLHAPQLRGKRAENGRSQNAHGHEARAHGVGNTTGRRGFRRGRFGACAQRARTRSAHRGVVEGGLHAERIDRRHAVFSANQRLARTVRAHAEEYHNGDDADHQYGKSDKNSLQHTTTS